MTELQTNAYTILSGVSGVTGGVYYGEMTETAEGSVTTYPYSVFEFLSSPHQGQDTNSDTRIAKIQVDTIGGSGVAFNTIADGFKSALETSSNWSLTAHRMISRRSIEDFRKGPFPIPSEDNEKLWQLTQQFTIEFEEI